MNCCVAAFLLLCLVAVGHCRPWPAACDLPCATRADNQYVHHCTSGMEFCTACRNHFCQLRRRGVIWWNPFAEVQWNPHDVKTCDQFPSTVRAKCTNDNRVSSKCDLSCARGYMPSPELYKEYGNTRWSYTHQEVMSFSVTCGYTADGSSVAWSKNEFSCVSKDQVLKTFYPKQTSLIAAAPPSPYPDDYVLKMFERELQEDVENENRGEASGGGFEGRSLWVHQQCKFACMWENGGYKFGCQQVGVYYCFGCRLTNICASSRSFVG